MWLGFRQFVSSSPGRKALNRGVIYYFFLFRALLRLRDRSLLIHVYEKLNFRKFREQENDARQSRPNGSYSILRSDQIQVLRQMPKRPMLNEFKATGSDVYSHCQTALGLWLAQAATKLEAYTPLRCPCSAARVISCDFCTTCGWPFLGNRPKHRFPRLGSCTIRSVLLTGSPA